MESDQEIDPLFLDVDPKRGVIKHEGRHRAVAAERLGIETIPVLVYIYAKGEGYQEASPENIRLAKRALALTPSQLQMVAHAKEWSKTGKHPGDRRDDTEDE